MKAVVFSKLGVIELSNTSIPQLKDGEALIKVNYCGICGSDIHILE